MTELQVFRSLARGEEIAALDLDLLKRVPEGTGLFALGRFTQELQDLLGLLVEVVPQDSVKAGVRHAIEWDLVPP